MHGSGLFRARVCLNKKEAVRFFSDCFSRPFYVLTLAAGTMTLARLQATAHKVRSYDYP